ncbi:hypothetical protein EBR57_07280 [bacterium]|nr:hypothetical protein [bacterium]
MSELNPISPIISSTLRRDQIHPDIFSAYDKAVATLRSRYSNLGILAGKKHFSDLWARDFCFAGLGALGLGDYDTVKQGLETLLSFIQADGQIPLRVGQKHFLLKYMGIDAKIPQARYIDDKGHSVAVDNNSLFVILTHRYVTTTSDTEFLIRHYDAIKKAVLWNFTQDSDYDSLMEEGYFAGWADSLKKEGKVLYTNVLHYQAVRAFSELSKGINPDDHLEFNQRADEIADRIQAVFWEGSYFIDWVTASHRQSTFSSDGNVLAIIFGIASPNQSRSIQTFIQSNQLTSGFSTSTRYPQYRTRHIYWPFLLINMADYHNGMEWLWVGCADVVSKWHSGHHAESVALITQIAHKIIEFGGVYEVYHKGAPVRRLFYKSEEWFAWSSGMFVWACHELGIPKLRQEIER